jgi:hypothetical protein
MLELPAARAEPGGPVELVPAGTKVHLRPEEVPPAPIGRMLAPAGTQMHCPAEFNACLAELAALGCATVEVKQYQPRPQTQQWRVTVTYGGGNTWFGNF